MEPNLKYIHHLVRVRDWSGSELARRMGVSRAEANRFLNGKRKGGNKVISGLLQAFPEEKMESLFILPKVEPNVNISVTTSAQKNHQFSKTDEHPLTQDTRKRTLKPVKHPHAHQIACSVDEASGIVEIKRGKNVTLLSVPIGPIEVRHTTTPDANTS